MENLSEDYQRIEKAITFIEKHCKEQPSLEDIAQAVGLSQYHFLRLFKRFAGVTPKQFLQCLTTQYAKECLARSESILEASFSVGLSGPSRLHDLFITVDAMTPGEYKAQGLGLFIKYGVHQTPFGTCLIGASTRGICHFSFLSNGDSVQSHIQVLQQNWPKASVLEDNDGTAELISYIFANAGHERRQIGLLLKGSNFQIKIWQALLNIPLGERISYEGVACSIGSPKSTRAVASAIARNNIAFLIPCHRVISKSGAAHGYRWGTSRKQAILAWELSQAPRMSD